jgi:uncharacterized coiled-coil protein SlyX
MADDIPNREQRQVGAQEELNRQALVSLGKRIAELEERMADLQGQIDELNKFSGDALETAKRLQGAVKELARKLKYLKQKAKPDVDNTDDDS